MLLQLLPVLRPLQPRLYSISSTPLEEPYGVQVSVAVVQYETLGEEREGVCSTYLAGRLEVRQTGLAACVMRACDDCTNPHSSK